MQDTPKTLVYLLHTLAHNKIRNSETSVSSPQLQEPGAYTMPIMRTPCTFSGGGGFRDFYAKQVASVSTRSKCGAQVIIYDQSTPESQDPVTKQVPGTVYTTLI